MRKPDFCICENKDADQLRGNREADQRLCFRYTDSTISLLPKYENFNPPAIFCRCAAWFVWDLVGNHEDRFSHNEAQMASLHFRKHFQMPSVVNINHVKYPHHALGHTLHHQSKRTLFHKNENKRLPQKQTILRPGHFRALIPIRMESFISFQFTRRTRLSQ